MMQTHYDVIVIGGGASGLMAAGRAASRGNKVLVLEKNTDVGKKLAISGGGRCNILNAEEDVRALLAHYGDAAKFLHTPFAYFGMQATRDFFEKELGLPIVVEVRKRAFPKSNKASDVVKVLVEWCKKNGVEFKIGHEACLRTESGLESFSRKSPRISSLRSARLFSRELSKPDSSHEQAPESLRKNSLVEASPKSRPEDFFEESFLGRSDASIIYGVEFDGELYTASSYVLATGGLSHPETGSTGDGFGWLRELGHTVVDPTPTIVPLAVGNEMYGAMIKQLSGISLTQAKVTFFVDGVKKFAREGDILCTHFGLSGPTILNAAGKVATLLKEGEVTARIDLFPKDDVGSLDKKVVALFEQHKNKDVDNALSELLPAGLVRELLAEVHKGTSRSVPSQSVPKVHSFSKDDRKHVVQMLKNLTVEITGLLGFDKAVVADGGVPLSEIDTQTFASKKVPNLYITGDLLHINRPSGGYSLQLCWTSGYVAGSSV